ncbi:Acb2/Tad1 domain-containing protein [Bacillus cereus group sp. BceL008]|uniref:Acb2/Tad1 domain-containing protein n=1 Tax=Bacillus cereus group sp. BceL008 TaxID=3445220 RepID=UPI003F224BD4
MMKSKEDLLKEALDKFMYTIGAVCPNGREKSVAITNAETAYLWAKESLSKTERK